MGLNLRYIFSLGGILKACEISFIIVAFSILRADFDYMNLDVDAVFFGVGVTVSCLIITPLLLACYCMGRLEIQQTILEVTVNFVYAVLLSIFGGLSMDNFVNHCDYNGVNATCEKSVHDSGVSMATFSLGASAAYFGDTVVAAFRYHPSN